MVWTRRVVVSVAAVFIVATVTPALTPVNAVIPGAMAMAPMSATDESKVPHYFGPYSNWANSPQVLANAIVTIDAPASTGGTTAVAAATVNPKTGGIDSIAVPDPGSGYAVAPATPPAVTIASPGVTPSTAASAHAVVSAGVVTSVAVAEVGFGFTAPKVTFTGGGTPTTPAVGQASGAVDDLTFTVGSAFSANTVVTIDPPDAANRRPSVTT